MMTPALLQPPLDIQVYHIEELAFRALQEYDSEQDSSSVIEVDFDIDRDEEDPNAFRIVMRIKLAENGYTAEENPPYMISLVIVGYFSFAKGTAEDIMQRMINLNGTSILYGIARGLVGQATGASKHGQFVLPAVNFVALIKARAESHDLAATGEIRGVEAGAEQ